MATSKFFQSSGREAEVTRAITRAWWQQFDQMIASDVLVVGSGPSGLVCARDLARQGARVVVVEQANHLGGGFWNGGYLANKAAIRHPAERILEELRVPLQDVGHGITLCDPPHAVSALIAACYATGVRFLNLTVARDVIWRENRLEGLVINWAPLYAMPMNTAHVDPIPLESRVVVDATGHDAAVVRILAKRKLCPEPPGNGAMWIEESEEEVVKRTGEYVPNLWVCGLAVAAVHGTPRMGPAFGSMLLSGERAAEQISARLHATHAPAAPATTRGFGGVAPAVPAPTSAGLRQPVNLPGTPTPVAPTRSFAPGAPLTATPTPPAMPAPAITPPVTYSPSRTASGLHPSPTGSSAPRTPSGTHPAMTPPPQIPAPPPPPPPPPARPATQSPTPAGPDIPTVNPETGRWTRGSTSRFFRKKPPT
jgi:thiamine thiazole synthase